MNIVWMYYPYLKRENRFTSFLSYPSQFTSNKLKPIIDTTMTIEEIWKFLKN